MGIIEKCPLMMRVSVFLLFRDVEEIPIWYWPWRTRNRKPSVYEVSHHWRENVINEILKMRTELLGLINGRTGRFIAAKSTNEVFHVGPVKPELSANWVYYGEPTWDELQSDFVFLIELFKHWPHDVSRRIPRECEITTSASWISIHGFKKPNGQPGGLSSPTRTLSIDKT